MPEDDKEGEAKDVASWTLGSVTVDLHLQMGVNHFRHLDSTLMP